MKTTLMCQWILEITALCFLSLDCKATGSTISLTIEGEGIDLVGPHCPGTVRLVCEGVDLTFLEWTYNGHHEIIRYSPHTSDTTVVPLDDNPAFVSVQLTELPQCSQSYCNFSSVLTAEMLQLQQHNINNISCGALGITATITVNVTVPQPFSTTTLNITNVTAYYSEGELNSVEVYWDRLVVQYQSIENHTLNCSVYESTIVYSVIVFGSERPVQISHTGCGETMCSVVLTNFNMSLNEYNLTLSANEVVSSESMPYPTAIASHSEQYLVTEINITSCQAAVQCTSAHGHSGQCTVQYTAGPMCAPSDLMATQLNSVLATLIPNTTYCFAFSLVIQEGFVVKERQVITTMPNVISVGTGEIAVLVLSALFILFTVVHSISVLVLLKAISTTTSKKKLLLFSTVLLILLLLACATLLALTLINIIKGRCIELVISADHLINAMLVISCLGITFIVIIWISVGYSVCQQRGSQKVRTNLERINHRYEHQDPPQGPNSNRYDHAEVVFQDQIEKSGIENELYECIQLKEHMGSYDTLEHSTRHSMMQQDSADGFRNEAYSMIEDPTPLGAQPQCGSTYQQLRPGEKSRPVANIADPNYSHISKRKRQPEPDIPDILHSLRAENMRDDYDVLGRELDGRASFVSVQSSSIYNSYYETLDETAVEPRMRASGVYDQLRPGEKSKAVPNMDDHRYSHVHVEDEQPVPVVKKKPKSRVFRKIK